MHIGRALAAMRPSTCGTLVPHNVLVRPLQGQVLGWPLHRFLPVWLQCPKSQSYRRVRAFLTQCRELAELHHNLLLVLIFQQFLVVLALVPLQELSQQAKETDSEEHLVVLLLVVLAAMS
jgi:hypothetical protein